MAFFVPEKYADFFDEVNERFRLLIGKGVVSGVTELTFNKWLGNFGSDEERYLCAQLLANLTFRSEEMVKSALKHILMCILPCELRRAGIDCGDLENFVEELERGPDNVPFRFVQTGDVKGKVGKSGPAMMRGLHRLGGVSNNLLCDMSKIDKLPKEVRCLVFVDDVVGSGKQFSDFAEQFQLSELSASKHLIYCPLAAYQGGVEALEKSCPWLRLCPVEQFDESHRFYRRDAAGRWALDGSNSVDDVKAMVKRIQVDADLAHSEFERDLLLGFHNSTPNNTISLLWAKSARWSPLLVR